MGRHKPKDPDAPKKERPQNKHLNPPWPKGVSGNPKGRPPGVPTITERIKRMLANDDDEGYKMMVRVAEREAKRGDFRYWNAIMERIDGKVPDRIAGHDGGPLVREVIGFDPKAVCGSADAILEQLDTTENSDDSKAD